jgi:hypothetical protein
VSWRVGSKVLLNVYDDDGEPVCQTHTPDQARRIVAAVNDLEQAKATICRLIDERGVFHAKWAHAEALLSKARNPASEGAEPEAKK